ncbi:MAG: HsdM family class I SAM-dependent methyltransferase [Anaerolineae bacterium]
MLAQAYPAKLPSNGPKREALRQKGQFWTPAWVAEAMVGYVVAGGSDSIFDPAVGAGAFFLAAKAMAEEIGRSITLMGTEIDPDALLQAHASGLSEADLSQVQITDFVLYPPQGLFKAIVANPPYIRHHRLPRHVKAALQKNTASILGFPIDGRAGLHIHFLVRALRLLDVDGRLAFIVPADTCEGVFAPAIWEWITKNYRLEAVVTFAPEASPFPTVDTNPLILMIRKAAPQRHFLWARCTKAPTPMLRVWTLSGFASPPSAELSICQREVEDGLATGLSRPPAAGKSTGTVVLADFAKVLRGIATGANEFFFMTREKAMALGIPAEFLRPAIGRTRDIPGDELNSEMLARLDAKGRPTLLFSPDGRPMTSFPEPVRAYLRQGEESGLATRALIRSRQPWYKMETRIPPPFLFAYLGRRNARFIRNHTQAVPLTGFLCVYPHDVSEEAIESLWAVLRHPETIVNLALVGKSYGAGAIKVEPRALERLPIPDSVLSEVGLRPLRAKQLRLLEGRNEYSSR